jgi:hypothetical protein
LRPDGGGASFFGWGTAGSDNGEMAPALDGDGLKNIRPYRIFGLLSYLIRLVSFNNSAFFYYISLIIISYKFDCIRPAKSAYFS